VGTLAGIRNGHNRQEIAAFDIGAKMVFSNNPISVKKDESIL
jgi:hypothetical protein